jgi:cellulose synthase/poly-beta-1,6-N-acetylglucosamine synthase-like glycosyltransferase
VRVAYLVVVVALLVTGISIWMEGIYALRPIPMPEKPSRPYPAATAIIAAYLPNEADTILDTLEAFLRIDYPAELQVIVAYNSPRSLPVEDALHELAARESRIEVMKVEGSTSKAQNVNTAVAFARGEVIGVFDADHQPARDAFRRAWHWLCDDYDVVQGHCVVRNGDATWVARTVAVEFEAIYAVSHPGRARLHGFGIFGGSNGYWRAARLRETRMRGSMLTEDIDSSLRVMQAGGRIASDPRLYSRELAPTTIVALWNQRMRWAQGWFQVSLRHVGAVVRSPGLSVRQRVGLWMLLGWREAYPWIAIQMIPIIAFLAVQAGGVNRLDWVVPLFLLTTLFTLTVGPGQTLFAWLLGAPEIKAHSSWFLQYLLVASLLYTEFKNVINRISQIKEFSRDRQWRVTPRDAAP